MSGHQCNSAFSTWHAFHRGAPAVEQEVEMRKLNGRYGCNLRPPGHKRCRPAVESPELYVRNSDNCPPAHE
jgi:hypothetical protein